MSKIAQIPWTRSGHVFRQLWEHAIGLEPQAPGRLYVPDMLATMVEQQRRHMAVYEAPGSHPDDSGLMPLPIEAVGDLSNRQTHEFFRRVMGYAVEEIMEAVGLFKGKPWKKNFDSPDPEKVKDEVGDALHFFFEALLALGYTAEDVFMAYFKASAKNVARQNGDY